MKKINEKYSAPLMFILMLAYFEYVEVIFRINTFEGLFDIQFLRILLFNAVMALVTTTILQFIDWKISKWIILVITTFVAAYGVTQLEFKIFMGNYLSWRITGDMGGKVTDYVIQFIKFIPFKFWICMLPSIVHLIVCFKLELTKVPFDSRRIAVSFIICTMLHVFGLMTLTNNEIYQNPQFMELGLRELGTTRFCYRDFVNIFRSEDEVTLEIEEETPVVTETVEEVVDEEEEVIDYTRYIDDSKWKQVAQEETNEDMKTIDDYLMSRPISDKNEMTGLLEDKNFIMVMVEAFDYMAIDETLTPTLYKMMHDGWYFTNYYTPKYSCTTGESEFISEVSLIPSGSVCTPNTYVNNTFSEAIFNLFVNKGYYATSYHNWKDEFYYRNTYHLNMGSKAYYDINDLDIDIIWGWQSDYEMVKEAYPLFRDGDDPFFAYLITSSTHFPYDEGSELGNRHLNEISEVYPDMPTNIKRYISKAMELDLAMEYLLNKLEEDGIADDTYIWLFADHHPLKTDLGQIMKWSIGSDIDRSEYQNIDRTPNFLYSSSIEPKEVDTIASTFDLLPTIANLFDLKYDPRVYVGTDIFGNVNPTVIFPNGDWIIQEGIYRASSGAFTPFTEKEVSNETVESVTKRVNNLFKISNLIYRKDYFKYRDFNELEN